MSNAGREVNARIVYWGTPGAGVSTNLATLHERLRPDHRGHLARVGALGHPDASYELLPIELGRVAGVRTRFHVIGAPSAPEHASVRKQLLDGVDGVVAVVDPRDDRSGATLERFDELRAALAAYGRSLDALPLVVQYNQREPGDPLALESLHRKLAVPDALVVEAVATRGRGVLETLTSISKRVVRALRETPGARPAAPTLPAAFPAPEPTPAGDDTLDALGVDATVELARKSLDRPWSELAEAYAAEDDTAPGTPRLREAGRPRVLPDGTLQLPLRLEDASGRRMGFVLSLRLEPYGDPETG